MQIFLLTIIVLQGYYMPFDNTINDNSHLLNTTAFGLAAANYLYDSSIYTSACIVLASLIITSAVQTIHELRNFRERYLGWDGLEDSEQIPVLY